MAHTAASGRSAGSHDRRSIAHSDPASDLPATVLALGGTLVARSKGGERTIAAKDFFTGFLESALAPDEMLTEIRVPKISSGGWGFQKMNRRAQDWAIVSVAAYRVNGTAGVALVNMGSTPVYAQGGRCPAGGASWPTPPSTRPTTPSRPRT